MDKQARRRRSPRLCPLGHAASVAASPTVGAGVSERACGRWRMWSWKQASRRWSGTRLSPRARRTQNVQNRAICVGKVRLPQGAEFGDLVDSAAERDSSACVAARATRWIVRMAWVPPPSHNEHYGAAMAGDRFVHIALLSTDLDPRIRLLAVHCERLVGARTRLITELRSQLRDIWRDCPT
jgi:hypothetical protein